MDLKKIGYKLDICFVVDVSGGMSLLVSECKAKAWKFVDALTAKMAEVGKPIYALRVRLVDYTDYAADDDAIHATEFFRIPEERDAFDRALQEIGSVSHGGDGKVSNGLEALYTAIRSDWVTLAPNEKGRQVIVLLTDAYPLHLGERNSHAGYPSDMPATLADLEAVWDPSDPASERLWRKRRLAIFGPQGSDAEGHRWDEVMCWRQTIFSTPGENGVTDDLLDCILLEIVRSM